MSEDLVELLSDEANENVPVARVLRHVEGRPVCPHPGDFWVAMRAIEDVVVRLQGDRPGERVLPIDCRIRDGRLEFTHELREAGTAGRDQFIADVHAATEVVVLHHDESQFVDVELCEEVSA